MLIGLDPLLGPDLLQVLRAMGHGDDIALVDANFPGEALYQAPPRSYAERAYNIVRWTEMPRGGHFAAMEEPDLFVADVREWARETI